MVNGLLEDGLELTDELPEGPGVLAPDVIEFVWHGQEEGGQVGEGDVDQVLVGGSPRNKS